MNNREKIIGIGLALVDEKIRQKGVTLPTQGELINFLNTQVDTNRTIGGVTPNILSALTAFSPLIPTRLLACTGKDSRGELYRSRTSNTLGPLQIDPEYPTGVIALVIDDSGAVCQKERYLGAAEKVHVSKEDREEQNSLLLTDLTAIKVPCVFEESDKLLASLRGGNFFLNLAGLNPPSTRDQLLPILRSLRRPPDIVTGNENEFAYLTNTDIRQNPHNAFQSFPDTRLLILTRGDRGSLVRFEDAIFEVTPYPIPAQRVIDETGAGDTYAGIMLGALFTRPYARWTKTHVYQACKTAAFGAAFAVQTLRSRLSDEEMRDTRGYFYHMKSTDSVKLSHS